MADAAGKEKVEPRIGEIDTVDGQEPKTTESTATPVPSGPAADYPELSTVERHHYVAVGEIAKGGMGRVFEARDRRLGRAVAIKELLPKNRFAARRFEREARITARLQHPAIIHIYEAGAWPGGEPFFAMTRVSGRSLDKVVAERKTFVDRIGLLSNVISVADALAYAHSQRVIHRDLKPSNVLIGEFGETVVIDWGLAKDLDAPQLDPKDSLQMTPSSSPGPSDETADGSIVGTPAYMPPEQARGEPVDQRADVYALGALLYHVLVGHPPYTGMSSDDVIEKVKSSVPMAIREREPAVPADLIAIVGKAMGRAPAERYPSAAELASDLKRFQTGQLVAAHRYTPRQLVFRWVKRYRVVLAIVMLAIVVLVVVGVLSFQRVVAERDHATDEEQKVEQKRAALLVERGRSELLAERAGPALVNLAKAATIAEPDGAVDFLIADAMRPFAAEIRSMTGGPPLAVASNGKFATGGGGKVQLWNADGTPDHVVADGVSVLALAFEPGGGRLAGGGSDGVVHVWFVRGGAVRTIAAHDKPILDLDWSPDGTRIVTASADGKAKVWDAGGDRQKPLATSDCHRALVVSARFSPDGARVASASADESPDTRGQAADTIANVCVWNAQTGETFASMHHANAVNMVRWTSDGSRIITASDDGMASAWNVDGKPAVKSIHTGREVTVAIPSPDGRLMLVAGGEHVARVWKLPDEDGGEPQLLVTLTGHTDRIVSAAFSSDGRRVATAGNDKVARVWDTSTGQSIAAFEHRDIVASVAFVGHDASLLTASRDGTAHLWDLTKGVQYGPPHELMSPGNAIAVSRDGTVAAGADDGRVWLWRPRPDGTYDKPMVLRGHKGSVYAVAFSPDGKRLVTGGGDEAMIVWDSTGAQLGTITEQPPPVRQILFDGDAIVTVTGEDEDRPGSSGEVRRFVDGKLVPAISVHVKTLAIHDGIAVGTVVDEVAVWDIRRGRLLEDVAIHGKVSAIAFAKDGRSIILGGQGFARVHAIADGHVNPNPTIVVDGTVGNVTDVAMSSDGSRLYTASDDGNVRVWDAAKGKLLGTRGVRGAANALALAPDDGLLWVASEDKQNGWVSAWDVRAPHVRPASITEFVVKHDVPYELDNDDVVRAVGGSNGKR